MHLKPPRIIIMALLKVKPCKNRRSVMLPSRFVPLGGEIDYAGMRLRCVVRGDHCIGQACIGCDLRNCFCDTLQCSRSDREDGMSVWFVKAEVESDRNNQNNINPL